MMPSAPMMTMPSSKPKIGFSIESIVGNHFKNKSPIHYSHDSEGSEAPLSPLSDYGYPNQQKSPRLPTSPAEIHRALRLNEFSQMELHNQSFFSAQQFQAAAALAHAQQAGPGFPLGALPQHLPHMHNPNIPRDSYQLYPWLLSRHGRIFPHRFPGNFLLHPFRKPKRVRTAFSPTQLLKLEHAFESNQYVVGAERKTLAQQLSLTETQVKVWFQNRRTKHKRMQQEDDSKSGVGGNHMSSPNYDEDELIDMEMDDDCPSDDENNM
ncbi:unnamed protein product [Diamesa hyperborea]